MFFYVNFAQTVVNLDTAVITYAVVLKQLWKYSRGPDNISHLSFLQVYQRTKYYTTVLLIVSYLCLMVIPSFFLIIYPANWEHAPISTFVIFSCFLLSDTADAYLYVFKYATVCQKFYGMIVQLPCCRFVQVESCIPGANHNEVGRVNQDQIG